MKKVLFQIIALLSTYSIKTFNGSDGIAKISVSPNGKHIASAHWDGKIYVWDINDIN